MKRISLVLFIAMTSLQTICAQSLKVDLKYNIKPQDNGLKVEESYKDKDHVINISEAKMYVYLPEEEKNKHAAVVICPGGGYALEAINHEGHDFAKFLQARGIAAIVLKYRLPNGHHDIPLHDASTAIQTVRNHAKEWNIDNNKIGIAGFSAGGHLASTAATHFKKFENKENDARPDFQILLYPVISFQEDITHKGSRNNLLGKSLNKEMIDLYSNEMQVNENTPPTFLVHAQDDNAVPAENSIRYYQALKKHNVSCEMHIFPHGGHGFGMRDIKLPVTQWPQMAYQWINGILDEL
ncbi:alpha/beta hydrolase [Puteibacter caeruleilacunae]|nr:alpha/beta hydrolase [Puteibacter caeruleilacunae]